ncbi:MAG TPA: DMT family transporter [Methanothermobacter sp.]|nr:DMT family transporter [Methanothermobacter sp.]HOK72911.1 DMT family transporter [Methanothermobacter sp.]HOL69003.1 DMT family transporter [Methanothermobacter sp.]HPQ04860.1 DMT family transporter [Methanothermobacter sp.]HPU36833.1 DMT family transporter [Methanothermobacter sp.]
MKRLWGYVSVILATIFFGLSAPLNKIMVSEMDPIQIGALTYFIAGIFLLVVRQSPLKNFILDMLDRENDAEVSIKPSDYLILAVTAILSSAAAPLLFLRGLSETSAVNAALLLNVEVFFIILLGLAIFNESLKLKDTIGIFLLITGAFSIATNGEFQHIILTQNIRGNLLVIGAAFFWSLDTVLSKFLSKKRDLIGISAIKSFIGGLILMLILLALNMSLSFPFEMLPFLFSVSIFSIGCAFILIYFALREIGSTRVGSLFPLSSLFGAFFAFLILREPFGGLQIISAFIMILGIFILYHK